MPNFRRLANQPRGLSWRILICLALAVFILRAAIPHGFMAAPASSHVMLTLCSAAGPVSVPLEVPGQSDGTNGKHLAAETCAFGALSAHGVLPDTHMAPSLSAQQAYVASVVPVYRAVPALPPLGPPLGSRARPDFDLGNSCAITSSPSLGNAPIPTGPQK